MAPTFQAQVNSLQIKSNPDRLLSPLNVDISPGNSYLIDGTEVLSYDSLGSSVTTSKLTRLGTLNNLNVSGHVNLGNYFYFNSVTEKVSIGSDIGNAALTVVENGIELVVGSLKDSTGHIGTYSSHDLSIVTDNVSRINISRTGKIVIGHPVAQNADVEIQGKLFVRQLVVDQQNAENTPLIFSAAPGGSNYGKGMMFTANNIKAKQFILSANPDSFFSTEHINLDSQKSYLIGGFPILNLSGLGETVTQSHLKQLGTLVRLDVQGTTNLYDTLKVDKNTIIIGQGTTISAESFAIGNERQNLTLTNDFISFGTPDAPTANVRINGKLAIGLAKVSSDVDFEIKGNIRFADRLFAVGHQAPTTGSYKKGDIIWNSDPVETAVVGWVCVTEGTPGVWRGFGQIGPQ